MKKFKRWTDQELVILDCLVGCYPLPILVKKYNERIRRINGKKGLDFPVRTEGSIRTVINDTLGKSFCCIDNYLNQGELAKLLKIPYFKINYWRKRGLLKGIKPRRRKKKGFIYITIENFRNFAIAYPHLLKDADNEALQYLLGEKITKKINKTNSKRGRTQPIKVEDTLTGKRYRSISSAAADIFVHRDTLLNRIKKQKDPRWKIID